MEGHHNDTISAKKKRCMFMWAGGLAGADIYDCRGGAHS